MDERWDPARLTTIDGSSRTFALACLLVYMVVTALVTAHHEPWRDEADAWLVVRDLPLRSIVPQWTSDAGTPALWYVALKPLVGLGLPYAAENALNLLFAWAAAALLLLFAPFTRVTKILLLASFCLGYEYPVIARSYALSIALLFAGAAAWRTRQEHPLRFAVPVALAANANVHAALIAGVFLVISLDRRRWQAPTVIAAGLLVAFLQLSSPTGGASPHPIGGDVRPEAVGIALSQAFFGGLPVNWAAIPSAAIVVGLGIAIRRQPRALTILSLGLLSLLGLFTVVLFSGPRHSGFVLVVAVLAVWIAGTAETGGVSRAAAILLNTALAFSAWTAATIGLAEVRYAFSGAKEMAEYIRANDLERTPIAAHKNYTGEAILPWLPNTRLWYAGLGEYGTYMKWDIAMDEASKVPYETAMRNAQQHFAPGGKRWLLLLNSQMPRPETYGFRLLHRTSVPVFRRPDERYWLYEAIR